MPSTQDPGPVLSTSRLRLRPWCDDDLAPFAAMGADPAVMRHMPSLLDRAASDALAGKLRAHFADHGFGLWAVDLVAPAPRPRSAPNTAPHTAPNTAPNTAPHTPLDTAPHTKPRTGAGPSFIGFIGFVGLSVPHFETPFTPCVEIAWRLAKRAWGQGYATEAARAALDFGFTTLELEEIVSFTIPANTASIRVMERLGMSRDPAEDFDHPRVPRGHRLCRHVLYRLDRPTWRAKNPPREAPQRPQ